MYRCSLGDSMLLSIKTRKTNSVYKTKGQIILCMQCSLYEESEKKIKSQKRLDSRHTLRLCCRLRVLYITVCLGFFYCISMLWFAFSSVGFHKNLFIRMYNRVALKSLIFPSLSHFPSCRILINDVFVFKSAMFVACHWFDRQSTWADIRLHGLVFISFVLQIVCKHRTESIWFVDNVSIEVTEL